MADNQQTDGALRNRIREVAEAAAKAAGKIQREAYGGALNVDEAKRNDIKLEVDRLSEAAILKEIKTVFSDHAVLAEESGALENGSEYLWIIDPLDGTVNFFYGIPMFCTSIACYRRDPDKVLCYPHDYNALGTFEAAAVYAAALDQMFLAAGGQGATLNGVPIHATIVTDLAECCVSTGCGHGERGMRYFNHFMEGLLPRVRKTRVLGAAALDLCYVAAGRLSGYAEAGLYSWDIAAAAGIAKEAGAMIEGVCNEPTKWDIVVSGSGVFDGLKNLWDMS